MEREKKMNNKLTKKIIAALLMITCMTALLMGCSKKEKSAIIGDWTIESITTAGITLNFSELATNADVAATFEAMGISADNPATISAKEDGTVTMKLGTEASPEMKWEDKDGKITINDGVDTMDVTIADNKLTLAMAGDDSMSMIFVKK